MGIGLGPLFLHRPGHTAITLVDWLQAGTTYHGLCCRWLPANSTLVLVLCSSQHHQLIGGVAGVKFVVEGESWWVEVPAIVGGCLWLRAGKSQVGEDPSMYLMLLLSLVVTCTWAQLTFHACSSHLAWWYRMMLRFISCNLCVNEVQFSCP